MSTIDPPFLSPPAAVARPSLGVIQRLLANTRQVDECWEWQGHRNPKGYGRIKVGGVVRRAHRVSYAAFVGPIPDGLTLNHTCANPSCINPDHLELMTVEENTAEGNRRRARGWEDL